MLPGCKTPTNNLNLKLYLFIGILAMVCINYYLCHVDPWHIIDIYHTYCHIWKRVHILQSHAYGKLLSACIALFGNWANIIHRLAISWLAMWVKLYAWTQYTWTQNVLRVANAAFVRSWWISSRWTYLFLITNIGFKVFYGCIVTLYVHFNLD